MLFISNAFLILARDNVRNPVLLVSPFIGEVKSLTQAGRQMSGNPTIIQLTARQIGSQDYFRVGDNTSAIVKAV
jgi:hypothetical protein